MNKSSNAEGYSSLAQSMREAGISTQQTIDAFYNLFGNCSLFEKQEEIDALEVVTKQEEKQDLFEKFNIEHLEIKNLLEEQPEPQQLAAQPQPKTTTTVKTRLCMRYDTEDNYRNNCPKFTPLRGEICIVETTYSGGGYNPRKIIIGNGESTLLNMLDNGHYIPC